jgi:tyrosyl-DNA phosphodiesterase-1
MSIKEILSFPEELIYSVQFTYMVEMRWLVSQYPPQSRSVPMLVVTGDSVGDSERQLGIEGIRELCGHVKFFQAPNIDRFGTHHTKMMLLFYKTGLRVVITTANLLERDWTAKTQGSWVSTLFPRLNSDVTSVYGAQRPDRTGTGFGQDLFDYLSTYGYGMRALRDQVFAHDLTSANVRLVASVPGMHTQSALSKWGHMKLRKMIQEHITPRAGARIISQFSSIGSLGKAYGSWLGGELLDSFTGDGHCPGEPCVDIVFPSVENVRNSIEGYAAGHSLPLTMK